MSAAALMAAFRGLFCALLVIASLQTVLGTAHGHAALLAAAEVLGALLLAVRRTQWLGAWLLLAVFSCAQIAAALASAWPVRFALYGACALLIALMDGALRPARAAH